MSTDRARDELAQIVAATVAQSRGTCPFNIVARSAAEAEALRGLLKGKHGAKVIGVRLVEGGAL